MLFNSFSFFLFFAFLAIVYGFVKERYRWYVLLAFSMGFFLSFGIKGLGFLLVTTASTYFCARGIEKSQGKWKGLILAAGLILNFGILLAVKYFNFLYGGVVRLFGGSFQAIALLVPLGISFYTFQMMGYLIDVSRQVAPAQRNFLRMLLFAGYFPQMLNGPINRYNDIAETLYAPKPVEYTRCRNALVLFAWGLLKKLCVADNLNYYVKMIFEDHAGYHGIMILSGGVAYAIYLYADFSGCIDMARGVSAYFGISLKDNFNRPYFATSVEEFWRRWHITLSDWFRDYLFYPLQRTKMATKLGKFLRSKGWKKAAKAWPTALSLLIVWLVTGLWHGANMTYIVWGLYYGCFMIFGVFWNTYKKKKPANAVGSNGFLAKITPGLKMLRTFLIVCVGYILFRAATVQDAVAMLGNMLNPADAFGLSKVAVTGITFYKQVGGLLYFGVTVVSTVLMIGYDVLEERGISVAAWLQARHKIVKYLFAVVAVLLLLFMMSRSSGDFTYMQF